MKSTFSFWLLPRTRLRSLAVEHAHSQRVILFLHVCNLLYQSALLTRDLCAYYLL